MHDVITRNYVELPLPLGAWNRLRYFNEALLIII